MRRSWNEVSEAVNQALFLCLKTVQNCPRRQGSRASAERRMQALPRCQGLGLLDLQSLNRDLAVVSHQRLLSVHFLSFCSKSLWERATNGVPT
ncbi:hypothetical protein B0T26DRAFT_115945 [Lasiosphaeria miniovina]|uniref:Uncharacterized protein n=1 Tax=Lasiosphaeria miniovina TaxID=1954250 RepID=A0AA40B3M5_9PEZI|nr:uncharacterized protein B0T26DRAFT_115945 [Lasiosphaeria miniovina]KAK0727076.1 hypothetical protein B0T26DRAFT_115945 [Lasiosphaeria miniovina]